MIEAPEAPRTPFMHPEPGGVGYRVKKKPQEPSPLKDHLCAKFHPDPSSHLDFYREQTDTKTQKHTDIALYVLDVPIPISMTKYCSFMYLTHPLGRCTHLQEAIILNPSRFNHIGNA